MSKLFFSGVPTAMDVRKLIEAFGTPDVGVEVTHDEVAAAIGVPADSSRYRTVVEAWRRKLLHGHNIDMGAVRGRGFRSLSATERVDDGVKGVRQGTRKVIRTITKVGRVVTDDPILQHKQQVFHRYGVALVAETNKTMRLIEPPKPQQQAPRLVRGAS